MIRRLSTDEVDALVSEYERGDHPEAIANRHRISTTALYDLLADRGVPRRRRRLTDEQVDEMRALRVGGQSYTAIGRRFGVSRTAVSLRLSAID